MSERASERTDVDEFVERVRKSVFATPSQETAKAAAPAPEVARAKPKSVWGRAKRFVRDGLGVIPDSRRKALKRRVRSVFETFTEIQVRNAIAALEKDVGATIAR